MDVLGQAWSIIVLLWLLIFAVSVLRAEWRDQRAAKERDRQVLADQRQRAFGEPAPGDPTTEE